MECGSQRFLPQRHTRQTRPAGPEKRTCSPGDDVSVEKKRNSSAAHTWCRSRRGDSKRGSSSRREKEMSERSGKHLSLKEILFSSLGVSDALLTRLFLIFQIILEDKTKFIVDNLDLTQAYQLCQGAEETRDFQTDVLKKVPVGLLGGCNCLRRRETPLNAMASEKRSCTSRNSCQMPRIFGFCLETQSRRADYQGPSKKMRWLSFCIPICGGSNIIVFNDPSTQLCGAEVPLENSHQHRKKTYVYQRSLFFRQI